MDGWVCLQLSFSLYIMLRVRMRKTINIKIDPSFNFRTTNNPTHFCVVYCLLFMHDKRDDSFVIVWFKQGMGDITSTVLVEQLFKVWLGIFNTVHVKCILVRVQITLPQDAALIESVLLRAKTTCSGIWYHLESCSLIYVEWNPIYHEMY